MSALFVRSTDKSTTDRSSHAPVAGPIRAGLGALGSAAPRLASRIALALFMRPQRRRAPERERKWTAGARPLAFRAAAHRLAGWSVGTGPAILLVHGWSGRASQLGAFVEPLVRRGYRVVGFDGPGHGASDGRRSSLPEHAEAVREVGRSVGPLRAVVAHSLGTAATTIALRDGLEADRCAYIAPPAGMRYFVDLFCRVLGLPAVVADDMTRRIEERFDVRFESLDGPVIARTTPLPPVIIAHDRDDTDVPFAHARTLAEAWPQATVLATSGLGHRTILRDPEVVRRLVDFVDAGSERGLPHFHRKIGDLLEARAQVRSNGTTGMRARIASTNASARALRPELRSR